MAGQQPHRLGRGGGALQARAEHDRADLDDPVGRLRAHQADHARGPTACRHHHQADHPGSGEPAVDVRREAGSRGRHLGADVGPQRLTPRAAGGVVEVAGVGRRQRLQAHPAAVQGDGPRRGRRRPARHRVADGLAVLVGAHPQPGRPSSSKAGSPSTLVRFFCRR